MARSGPGRHGPSKRGNEFESTQMGSWSVLLSAAGGPQGAFLWLPQSLGTWRTGPSILGSPRGIEEGIAVAQESGRRQQPGPQAVMLPFRPGPGGAGHKPPPSCLASGWVLVVAFLSFALVMINDVILPGAEGCLHSASDTVLCSPPYLFFLLGVPQR